MRTMYARPPVIPNPQRQWPDRVLTTSPLWDAVDLRDGNQALPNPLTPSQKLRYFEILTEIGFTEIEIGFPSASADDFRFCRDLIEQNRIPDNVRIAVLTQARESLIRRTMEALRGVRRGICHVYVATSELHMQFVFGKKPSDVKAMTLESVRQIRALADAMPESDIGLELSPEEFTDSDLDFVVDLCDAVIETWNPRPGEKVVLNLPATVERRLPHEYADMIESFIRRQKHRDRSVISVHAHNDMGTAVAATQMAVLAGADRVEGTLFGHGERSGNVDLVTVALNFQYLGVDTGLDFSRLDQIRAELEELTSMPVHPRHPYAGELVFTAFSGSHQDAIHKGLTQREALTRHYGGWKIPYLHVSPQELGRRFEKFIRINSQSGKGGVAHVLETDYGVRLPRQLLIEVSGLVQALADRVAREVESREVWEMLLGTYLKQDGPLRLVNYWPRPDAADPTEIRGEVHVEYRGTSRVLQGSGSGPIAAFWHSLETLGLPSVVLDEYEEEAIGKTAEAEAITFVRLRDKDHVAWYGIGFGSNIDQAAVRAIVSALNRMLTASAAASPG